MWGWGHGNGMVLWWVIGLAAIVVFVWVVVRMRPGAHEEKPTAEEALRRRYAAGEIDEDEYRRRLRVLRGQAADDTHQEGP